MHTCRHVLVGIESRQCATPPLVHSHVRAATASARCRRQSRESAEPKHAVKLLIFTNLLNLASFMPLPHSTLLLLLLCVIIPTVASPFEVLNLPPKSQTQQWRMLLTHWRGQCMAQIHKYVATHRHNTGTHCSSRVLTLAGCLYPPFTRTLLRTSFANASTMTATGRSRALP